jgi:RimJ/RimL family protein N-acetyltransferase
VLNPDDPRTDRLRLRRWRPEDRAPFAALNADPEVMRHFPAVMSRAESDALVDRIEAHFAEHGYGLWAVEVLETEEFIGFTGLSRVSFETPFTPAVEIGWPLARPAWGHGYATEAARAALTFGFDHADLAEIVSFTSLTNQRSQAVMQRLGMIRRAEEDFDHPRLDAGHPLRHHVLYRMKRADWPADPSR